MLLHVSLISVVSKQRSLGFSGSETHDEGAVRNEMQRNKKQLCNEMCKIDERKDVLHSAPLSSVVLLMGLTATRYC